MNFPTAVKTCFKKYAVFQGRASRSEYWYFILFVFSVDLVLLIAGDKAVSLLLLFWLGTILPYWAVTVRRLHDTDHSGWWFFIVFVPLVGVILWLIWFCTRGTPGNNRFGPDTLAKPDSPATT